MLQTSGKVTPFLWFESQAEVDRYWETLVADGGSPRHSACEVPRPVRVFMMVRE